MNKIKSKCTVEGDHVKPCNALSKATAAPAGHSKKGVVVWSLTNIQTMKRSRTYYGVKSGDFSKNGVVFNFCPFCGVDHTQVFLTSEGIKEDE